MNGAVDIVVRGRVTLPGSKPTRGAVAISDGKVAAVGAHDMPVDAARELDVGDALILPGVVDVHVHTRSAPREGIGSVTRAAAAGGVTTIVDMPYDAGGLICDAGAFAAKVADVEREAAIDVALWATVAPEGPLDTVAELAEAGACAFKLSTFGTDPRRFPRIDDGRLLEAFAAIAATGRPAGVHSESDEIVRRGLAREKAADPGDLRAHARSRPAVAEAQAIASCLELARATGVALHLCHVTIARGVALAVQARRDGVDVSAETCPHYLLLDEDELERQGPTAKINPPLRPAAQVQALWDALAAGSLDLVSSDHVGWGIESKRGADVLSLASGAPGVELILSLMHDALGAHGLGVPLLVRLLCETPARRFGLWPAKGSLLPGADADLVVLDPDEAWEVDPAALVTACGWSPYAGRHLRGRVRHVFSRGEQVLDAGRLRASAGRGRFVAADRAPTRVPAHA